jgi:hypothetical protein
MATATKLVKMKSAIEPELKAFLDEVLVPMLVRDGLKDLAAEGRAPLAPKPLAGIHFPPTPDGRTEELV